MNKKASSAAPSETEADSADLLKSRYLAPRALKARLARTLVSSPSQKPTPAPTASTSAAKANTRK